MSIHEAYSEAILFMLDSISPTQRIQLKDDLRLKLDRAYELQPSTLQGLKILKDLMKVSQMSRTIQWANPEAHPEIRDLPTWHTSHLGKSEMQTFFFVRALLDQTEGDRTPAWVLTRAGDSSCVVANVGNTPINEDVASFNGITLLFDQLNLLVTLELSTLLAQEIDNYRWHLQICICCYCNSFTQIL